MKAIEYKSWFLSFLTDAFPDGLPHPPKLAFQVNEKRYLMPLDVEDYKAARGKQKKPTRKMSTSIKRKRSNKNPLEKQLTAKDMTFLGKLKISM